MDTESAAVIFQHVQISRYVDAAGLVFLLYDHILTFGDEVRLVWTADTTLPKLLFLVNRYIVPIALICRTNDFSGLALLELSDNAFVVVSRDWINGTCPVIKSWINSCKIELAASVFLGMISIAISNFLVLLRIWVLWERKRQLMYWTGAAFLVAQIGGFTVSSIVVARMNTFVVYSPDFHGCLITQKGDFSIASLWVPGLAFEVLVFVVVWWNAFDRSRESNDQLSKVLYREGIIYFLVLFSLRLLNLILGIVAPVSLIFLGMLFIWCASTTTTSHFIFKLRKLSVDGPRGDVTDIELQYSNFPELRSVTTVVGTDSEMKRTQSVEKYTS